MKKICFICFICFILSCSQNKVSAEECESVVEELSKNLLDNLSEEEKTKWNTLKSNMIPVLEKECRSGKYELSCLRNAKDPLSLRSCIKTN